MRQKGKKEVSEQVRHLFKVSITSAKAESLQCLRLCSLISLFRRPFGWIVVRCHFVFRHPTGQHGTGIENLLRSQGKIDVSRGQRDQRQSRESVEQEYQTQLIFQHAVGPFPERRINLHKHQNTSDNYRENNHCGSPMQTFLLKVVFPRLEVESNGSENPWA